MSKMADKHHKGRMTQLASNDSMADRDEANIYFPLKSKKFLGIILFQFLWIVPFMAGVV